MKETVMYDNLVKIASSEEFKWVMFKWYMQELHNYNYWDNVERH
jgi:hypothetical protein